MVEGPAVVRLVVVKRGREWSGCMVLDPGDRIASRWFDAERGCHVVEVVTEGVPPSAEVVAAGVWDCDERGHRFVYGIPVCLECGSTYA